MAFEQLTEVEQHLEEVLQRLNEPDIASDTRRMQELLREAAELQPVVDVYRNYRNNEQTIADSLEMLEAEKDEDMRGMLKEELAEARKENDFLKKLAAFYAKETK